jgi:hypothetical protein
MRRTITIIASMLLLSLSALAQTNYEDVVYLKNGSVIHGMIIETIPNQTIKIKTKDGNLFVYKMDEILKMTKESVQSFDNNNFEIKETGFTNITEIEIGVLDVGTGGNGLGLLGLGLRTINGIQINKHFSIGLGIGFNWLPNYDLTTDIISQTPIPSYSLLDLPVFLDFRYYLTSNKHSFFAFANFGYSILLSSSSMSTASQIDTSSNYYLLPTYYVSYSTDNYILSGGIMYGLGIGYKLFISHNVAWTISIGYNYTGTSITDNNTQYSYTIGVLGNNSSINSSPKSSTSNFGDYVAIRTGFAF